MAKLYLVRHAEPEITGVLLGRLDPGLTEAGRERARNGLSGLSVAVAYSSPLRRARETADIIPAQERIVLDDLAELGLGEWDGLAWDQIERTYPELARRKLADWLGVTPPGGEPWGALEIRIGRALQRIASGPFPAAVVGHVAVNAEIARRLAGVDPVSFNQAYCEISEYEVPLVAG